MTDTTGAGRAKLSEMVVGLVNPYPGAICGECGEKHGNRTPTCATWWPGTCGWCGVEGYCTEPRDYGWPVWDRTAPDDTQPPAKDTA